MSSYPATYTVETEILRMDFGQTHVVLLLHGFPDDVRTWDVVAEATRGRWVSNSSLPLGR